jgi:hypothetical protein
MFELRPRPGEILPNRAPPLQERRRVLRPRVLLSGKLVFKDPPLTVDCAIRDLTELGARVVLAPDIVAPRRGWLVNLRAGCAYETVVIWRAAGLLGLRFGQTIDVTHPLPEGPMDHLHRLWIECAGR